MGRLQEEKVTSYPKMVFTRAELMEKLGFDPDDAFDVNLLDWGRTGVSFTLHFGKAAKYKPVPVTESVKKSVKKSWIERMLGK